MKKSPRNTVLDSCAFILHKMFLIREQIVYNEEISNDTRSYLKKQTNDIEEQLYYLANEFNIEFEEIVEKFQMRENIRKFRIGTLISEYKRIHKQE